MSSRPLNKTDLYKTILFRKFEDKNCRSDHVDYKNAFKVWILNSKKVWIFGWILKFAKQSRSISSHHSMPFTHHQLHCTEKDQVLYPPSTISADNNLKNEQKIKKNT